MYVRISRSRSSPGPTTPWAQYGSACRQKVTGSTARPRLERCRRRNPTAACGLLTGMPSAWPRVLRKVRAWNSSTVAEVWSAFGERSAARRDRLAGEHRILYECALTMRESVHRSSTFGDPRQSERLHPCPVAQRRTLALRSGFDVSGSIQRKRANNQQGGLR